MLKDILIVMLEVREWEMNVLNFGGKIIVNIGFYI